MEVTASEVPLFRPLQSSQSALCGCILPRTKSGSRVQIDETKLGIVSTVLEKESSDRICRQTEHRGEILAFTPDESKLSVDNSGNNLAKADNERDSSSKSHHEKEPERTGKMAMKQTSEENPEKMCESSGLSQTSMKAPTSSSLSEHEAKVPKRSPLVVKPVNESQRLAKELLGNNFEDTDRKQQALIYGEKKVDQNSSKEIRDKNKLVMTSEEELDYMAQLAKIRLRGVNNEILRAGTLWQENPALILLLRRPGCGESICPKNSIRSYKF